MEEGTRILETEGRAALTIAAVCRRAKVAPTAIYARVDGLAGLFWAIYDRHMSEIVASYNVHLDEAAQKPAGTAARTTAVVRAVCLTFRDHEAFLNAIIAFAATDVPLRERGGRAARELIERAGALLAQGADDAGYDIARMVHQECSFRALYGDRWLTRERETFDAFVLRLTRMALPRLGQSPEA